MADDWDASDRKLYKASVAAIKQFARDNPDVEVCCFFFDCDEPRYGHLSISLDTLQNNIGSAKQLETFALESRQLADSIGNLRSVGAESQLFRFMP